MNTIFEFIVRAGLILAGMALIAVQIVIWVGAVRQGRWKAAQATILAAALEDDTTHDITYYALRVSYRFDVEGKEYLGEKFSDKYDGLMRRRKAEEFLQEYQPGTTHTVYFDPKDPNVSMLLPGTNGWLTLFLIGGGIVLIYAAFTVR